MCGLRHINDIQHPDINDRQNKKENDRRRTVGNNCRSEIIDRLRHAHISPSAPLPKTSAPLARYNSKPKDYTKPLTK